MKNESDSSLSNCPLVAVKDYKVGDVIAFNDGEKWKVTKIIYDKLRIKPHNEKAKKANTSIEIDIDLEYLKNNSSSSFIILI